MNNENLESASLLKSTNGGSYGSSDQKKTSVQQSLQQGHLKTIGYLGSVAIAVNSLAGPAILQLPFQYQQSGLIPTTLCLIVVAVLSCFCSLHMANVVSQVPDNRSFKKQIEFSDPFRIFWNATAYKVTQVLFFLCTVCLNVAAIVDTAEVVDSVFGLHWKTFGLNVPVMQIQEWQHKPCARRQVKLGLCEPFADQSIYGGNLLTLGYILTALVFVPICLMDLKENTVWQIVGFVILVTSSIYFCGQFLYVWGSHYDFTLKNLEVWGHQWSDMLGVILFNFSLVLAIPAWLHEKKSSVNVNKVVTWSTVLATFLYILVGALGAFTIPKVNVNMLEPMMSGAYGEGMQVTGSIFAFFIIGLDIPLFSVLTRYNLTHSGLCSETLANWLVVWIPWLTSWVLYQGDAIGRLLDWGGVLLTSIVAYLLPLYLALRVLVSTDAEGSIYVYGRPIPRGKQVKALYVLLFMAAVSIIVAITGQIVAEREYEEYIHSEQYLNATVLLQMPQFNSSYLRKHHHHHLHRGHLHHGSDSVLDLSTPILSDVLN